MYLPLSAGARPEPPLIAPRPAKRGLDGARRVDVMLRRPGRPQGAPRGPPCAWVLPRALDVVSIFPPAGRDLTVAGVRELLCCWCARVFGALHDRSFPKGRPLLVCRTCTPTVLRSLASWLTGRYCRLSAERDRPGQSGVRRRRLLQGFDAAAWAVPSGGSQPKSEARRRPAVHEGASSGRCRNVRRACKEARVKRVAEL